MPDRRKRYRFISSEPVHPIEANFSRWRRLWEEAKRRLMLLPPRNLRQEQAFESILKFSSPKIEILFPAGLSEKKIRRRFFFFLQRQRSSHILLLIGETILLPVSGLMALIPGPNIFFGILALIMYAHWQGLRGINRLAALTPEFRPSDLLGEWRRALEAENKEIFPSLLACIEKEYLLSGLKKVLLR